MRYVHDFREVLPSLNMMVAIALRFSFDLIQECIMKSFRLCLAVAICGSTVIGLTGCSEDNNKAIVSMPAGSQSAPPKSQKEYMEAQKQKTGPSGYGGGDGGYPGDKGGPPK